MVVFDALPTLVVATFAWIIWRVVVWHRGGKDPVRELVVALFFVWSLVVVRFTFFPMVIVFYDWHSRVNLVPFSSILQLLRETAPATAFENIVGNVLLFIPVGFLLPLLFTRLRSPWALLWRSTVISAFIEVLQVFTRARALDVDDVILNVTGAMIGYGLYAVAAAIAGRSRSGSRLLQRLGADAPQEPLLAAKVPVVFTLLVVLPMMFTTIVGSTLADGPSGIEAVAGSDWPQARIAARADLGEHTFLVVSDGPTSQTALRLVGFERVLPGRYTWVSTSELPSGVGSRYDWTITAFNVARNEAPTVVVWGSNADGAAMMSVSGNGVEKSLTIPAGDQFVVGFDFEASAATDVVLDDFAFIFTDAAGNDVSDAFTHQVSG